MRVQGAVSRAGQDKWRVELVLRGPEWEAKRALDGPTCAAVSEAAALVIALAINPEIEPPPPPPKPESPERERPSRSPSVGGPSASLAGTVDAGMVPGGTAGVEGNLGWTLGAVHVELGGSYFAERRATLADRDDVGATFRLGSMSARGCYQFQRDRLMLGPCLDIGALWTKAQGFGPIARSEVSSVTPSVGGALGIRWLISSSFAPFVRIGAIVPVARPEFAVQGMGHVHRAAPVAVRGALGLEVHFD